MLQSNQLSSIRILKPSEFHLLYFPLGCTPLSYYILLLLPAFSPSLSTVCLFVCLTYVVVDINLEYSKAFIGGRNVKRNWTVCSHYMYRTVVTICSAKWSLYVPQSGHYMYRTEVTICTAQRSLYVPHSGHNLYRTVVTACTAQ